MTQLDETLAAPLTDSAPLGAWLFRNRSWLPVPLAILLVAASHPAAHSTAMLVTGVILACAGEGLRIWAVRHIGEVSRTRTSRTGPLVTSGPYAAVRNPLYLGNWLLWTGMVVCSSVLWMLPVIWMAFVVIYGGITAWEERLMLERSPDYAAYLRTVPAWIPRGLAGRADRRAPTFSWPLVLFSERSSFLALLVMVGLLIWRQTAG